MITYKEYCTCRKPYQELGFLMLLERKHACLFYKPGKGKTYPTIDAIRDVDKSKNGNAKVLILSTASAIKMMWMEDIVPQNILPYKTVLMSFTKAVQEETKRKLLSVKWDVIVIDESHHIKSHNSKISKLVFNLTKKCEYAFGLTGTPRGNSDIDIYCQFHNLNISSWGEINYTTFTETCCDIDKKFFNGAMIKVPIGINERYRAGFLRNVAMYSQFVDYDDDDKMPDMEIEEVKIPFTPSKEYLFAEEGVIKLTDYETTLTKLAAICKLQQLANGYLYVTEDSDESKRRTVQIAHNNKAEWIRDNLKAEHSLVVYRNQEECNQLRNILSMYFGENCYTDDITTFKKGNHKVLLLQCSQSESFNLQMCSNVIFYTMDYSFINFDQMLHRVYRMGQKDKVKIQILINENSVEQKIWNAVNNKRTLSELFYSIKGEL